jgi:hypothetical protein
MTDTWHIGITLFAAGVTPFALACGLHGMAPQEQT